MRTILLVLFSCSTVFRTVFGQLLIPGCPSLSDQGYTDVENQRVDISESVCYCDNGTDYGSDSFDSISINCIYPASLGDLAFFIKLVRKAQMQINSISMVNIIPTKDSIDVKEDFYFKNLDAFPSHLSLKSCANETTKTIIGDKFFAGLEDSLISLTIYDCPLQEFPSNLKLLKNLERLRLQSTSINEIKSDDLSSFEKLLTLDLQGNNMNKIDGMAFEKQTNLQSLVLGPDNNFNESIFASLRLLTNLVTLDLSGNKIAKVDEQSFARMESLEALYLTGNLLLTVSKNVFEKLGQLIELYLMQNLIDAIQDETFWPLKRLQRLSLKDNFLTVIKSETFDLPNLQSLDLAFNEIVSLDGKVFMNLPNLTNLVLHNNQNLQDIDKNAFSGLSELLSLDISSTNITTIDADMFIEIPKLTDLKLSHTRISDLSKNTFVNAKNLISLNLKDTQLSTIADGTFDENKNLNKLVLGENRWTCDKNLTYILKWLQENENNVVLAEEFRDDKIPTCYNPEKLRGLPLRAININQLTE